MRGASCFEYSACDKGIRAWQETTENVKTLVLKLLDQYDEHISSKVLLLHGARSWGPRFSLGGTRRGFTGLHSTVYFGCVEIIVAIMEMNK